MSQHDKNELQKKHRQELKEYNAQLDIMVEDMIQLMLKSEDSKLFKEAFGYNHDLTLAKANEKLFPVKEQKQGWPQQLKRMHIDEPDFFKSLEDIPAYSHYQDLQNRLRKATSEDEKKKWSKVIKSERTKFLKTANLKELSKKTLTAFDLTIQDFINIEQELSSLKQTLTLLIKEHSWFEEVLRHIAQDGKHVKGSIKEDGTYERSEVPEKVFESLKYRYEAKQRFKAQRDYYEIYVGPQMKFMCNIAYRIVSEEFDLIGFRSIKQLQEVLKLFRKLYTGLYSEEKAAYIRERKTIHKRAERAKKGLTPAEKKKSEKIKKVKELRGQGMSIRDIVKITSIPKSTVSDYLKKVA